MSHRWLRKGRRIALCLTAAFMLACGGKDHTQRAQLPDLPDAGSTFSAPKSQPTQRDGGAAPDSGTTSDCAPPGKAACDLISGCGCTYGETCRVDAVAPGAALCEPLPPSTRAPYTICNQNADCPELYSCIGGVCKKHCNAPQDCGWQGAHCSPVTLDGHTLEGAGYCFAGCDVVSPQKPASGFRTCGAGLQCVPLGESTDCSVQAGTSAVGERCSSVADCAAGLRCSSAQRCEPWCRVGGNDCAPGLQCSAVDDSGALGTQQLGTCSCQPPGGAVCDLALGCGCAAGKTCGYDGANIACRPLASSPRAPYDVCDTDNDCPALHSCIDGVCQRLCNTAAECGWPGAECASVGDASGQPIAGFSICERNCDPLSPEAPAQGLQACGSNETCFPYADGTGSCVAEGINLPEGAACSQRGCAPGLFCSGAGYCTRWCEVGKSDCPSGLTCEGFSTPFKSGDHELGSCACKPADGSICDPSTNCGCGPGTTCDYFIDERAFDCRPLSANAVAPNAICSLDTDCPSLYACLGGICKKLCKSVSDCPTAETQCAPATHNGNKLPGWNFCRVQCDLVSPAAPAPGYEFCPSGATCYALSAGVDCAVSAGVGAEGSTCVSYSDCAPGLSCDSDGRCERWCAVGQSCGSGVDCVSYDPAFVLADRELGRCLCAPANGATCDPTNDCGCDPGRTCRSTSSSGGLACFVVEASTAPPNTSCSTDDACPALYSCIDGLCKQHCADDASCGDPSARCEVISTNPASSVAPLDYCAFDCDPAAPSTTIFGFHACESGQQCQPSGASFDCAAAGSGVLGAACKVPGDCQPGLFCGADLRCAAWCHSDSAVGACPSGLSCVPLSQALSGHDGLGRCALCSDACGPADGICDDGGPNAADATCALGTDCSDCGAR